MHHRIPLYQNQGPYCAEYSLLGVFEFLGIPHSIDGIKSIIGRVNDNLLFPVEIVAGLHQEGISIQYRYNLNRAKRTIQRGVTQEMIDFYGSIKGKKIVETSNLPNIEQAIRYVLNNVESDEIDLEKSLSARKVPLLLIDFDILQGRRSDTKGHYVYITGFDNENYYYDDTGPVTVSQGNRLPKTRISELTQLVWFDDSTIIIG